MVAGGGDFGSGFYGLATKFCLTGSASMLAEGATFPVDITKTRLQLQGQVQRAALLTLRRAYPFAMQPAI